MTCILDSAQIASFETAMTGCTICGLVIAALADDCSTQTNLINSNVYVSNYNVQTSMDDAVTVDISFFYAGPGA